MADRIILTKEEAVSLLPEAEEIHCFSSSRGMLIGADWSRKSVVDWIAIAESCEIGGAMCRRMGHGLVVNGKDDSVLFFEADKDKLDKLEKEKNGGQES